MAAVTAASVAAVTAEAPWLRPGGIHRRDGTIQGEVERMVKEQLAKEKLSMLSAGGAHRARQRPALPRLEQYVRCSSRAMEVSVLVTLARSEGKEALDEALKEVGAERRPPAQDLRRCRLHDPRMHGCIQSNAWTHASALTHDTQTRVFTCTWHHSCIQLYRQNCADDEPIRYACR